ncbi:hypothetical protein [Lentilactobacillus sp. Marseille-Q4993]|uniref:hypothetical protein n=1 Tax=Lentilactobacillus sp. Marseille-Q4993 TaxID=3039492 RepID=UPI0024BC47FA|nr:hypothetical protein [Lentilactobacillus sp. Marseille-Q4993]
MNKHMLSTVSLTLGGCVLFGTALATPIHAQRYFPVRKIVYHTPASWRGTYHNKYGDVMKVYKYSVQYNGKAAFRSRWSGYRKLAFAKVDRNHYTFNALAKYGYQSSRRWRVIHKNGHRYLLNTQLMGSRVAWRKVTE